MRKLILIGGAPGIGKSYLAKRVAAKTQLPWISTDTVREMMRKIVRKEDFLELFHFSGDITAESYLSTHTARQIMDSQNKESVDVWKGVKAFMDTDYVWKDFIVEGIAVLPEFVSLLNTTKFSIKPIFLIDENPERIRKIVYTRGIWAEAGNYSDAVKEVEVEWVTLFNNWLKNETVKYGFQAETVGDVEQTQAIISKEVSRWLRKK